MTIKMRTIKNQTNITCEICGNTKKQSLEMFELLLTENIKITLCDLCNDKLLNKTLKASCNVQGKLKTKADLEVIRKRRQIK